jgi:hypothetical protein
VATEAVGQASNEVDTYDEDNIRTQHYEQDYDCELDADGETDYSSSPPPRQISPDVQAFNDQIATLEAA